MRERKESLRGLARRLLPASPFLCRSARVPARRLHCSPPLIEMLDNTGYLLLNFPECIEGHLHILVKTLETECMQAQVRNYLKKHFKSSVLINATSIIYLLSYQVFFSA